MNRDAKQNLEMDWSDKKEAHEIDTNCFNLRNGHTNKQFHPGSARYQEIQSTPESWAQVGCYCSRKITKDLGPNTINLSIY